MPKKKAFYKSSYDYPYVKGSYICSKCNKESKLPANYCCHCGTELEDYKKQGLKH